MIIRGLDISIDAINEYVLDDFHCEDKKFIEESLKSRVSSFNDLELEVGSGNGKFIVELALNNPDKFFIGLEYSYKSVKKTVSKAYKRDIKNMLIIFGEANNIIESYFKNKYFFNKLYLNFPDPWPKKKHANRRIFNVDFLSKVYYLLKENGIFYSVTDDDNYALEIMNPIYKSSNLFENILEEDYVHKLEGYGVTLYEEKMRAIGHQIYYFAHRKI